MPAELDDRFYPILLSHMDEPVEWREIEAYFEKVTTLADAAIQRRSRHVVIVTNDVTLFKPASRKLVADAQARFMTPERDAVTLAAFAPIDSALARGVLTALRWIAPDLVKTVRAVPSLEVAMEQALAALDAEGTPFKGDRAGLRRALKITR